MLIESILPASGVDWLQLYSPSKDSSIMTPRRTLARQIARSHRLPGNPLEVNIKYD